MEFIIAIIIIYGVYYFATAASRDAKETYLRQKQEESKFKE